MVWQERDLAYAALTAIIVNGTRFGRDAGVCGNKFTLGRPSRHSDGLKTKQHGGGMRTITLR